MKQKNGKKAADEVKVTDAPEPERELYRQYLWAGTIRYRCLRCEYDCDHEAAMAAHIDDRHTEKAPAANSPSGLIVADKNYRVLQEPGSRVLATVDITEEDLKRWTQ
jgi:hypothetical protein